MFVGKQIEKDTFGFTTFLLKLFQTGFGLSISWYPKCILNVSYIVILVFLAVLNGDVMVDKFKIDLPSLDGRSKEANQLTVLGHLQSLLVDKPLFVQYFTGSQTAYSGRINNRKMVILHENPLTDHIIRSIQRKFTIKDLWLALNECGMQKFHNAKLRKGVKHRMLLSF
jgi:hypothetical protein